MIVQHDEQHPKKGRTQKFRLTLLNYRTKQPIADELFDNKDDETIEAFLRKHLDTEKEIVIITDCDRRYPKANPLEECWNQGKDEVMGSKFYDSFDEFKIRLRNQKK